MALALGAFSLATIRENGAIRILGLNLYFNLNKLIGIFWHHFKAFLCCIRWTHNWIELLAKKWRKKEKK